MECDYDAIESYAAKSCLFMEHNYDAIESYAAKSRLSMEHDYNVIESNAAFWYRGIFLQIDAISRHFSIFFFHVVN